MDTICETADEEKECRRDNLNAGDSIVSESFLDYEWHWMTWPCDERFIVVGVLDANRSRFARKVASRHCMYHSQCQSIIVNELFLL